MWFCVTGTAWTCVGAQLSVCFCVVGVNAELMYSIVKGNKNGMFAINPHTGELRVAKSLDREKQASYELHIEATDLAVRAEDRLATTAVVRLQMKLKTATKKDLAATVLKTEMQTLKLQG